MNTGYCTNLPSACSLAARKEAIPMSAPDSKCPECGSGLLATKSQASGNKALLMVGAALVLLLGAGGYMFSKMSATSAQRDAASPPGATILPQSAPPTPGAKTLLRLSGSNTIGSALAPRMAQAWLTSMGATDVSIQQREQGGQKIPETVVRARLNNEPVEIDVRAHGSGEAFKHLADGSAEIGMSSRRIKADESAALSSLGNMYSRDSEHVIALDGIAVIVAPGNNLPSLSRQNLGKVFAGEITDWSQVGGPAGPIKLYARDDKSGTYDTFKSLVLDGSQRKLAQHASRFEDSEALEAAVAADASGMGFVGLPYVRSARAVPIADGQALALAPTVFTVKKEDYALARRLFLYTAANPGNPMVRKFTSFAISDAGQQVVKAVGFVGQSLNEADARKESLANRRTCQLGPQWPGAKDAYCRLIADKTDLGTNFRFQSGSAELDNKAVHDLQRVLQLLSDKPELKLTLVGFADAQGQYGQNIKLAEDRAVAVRQALRTLGITSVETTGFGQEIAVADNSTSDGRERNRRVEVWIQ